MITLRELFAAVPALTRARAAVYAPLLAKHMPAYGIVTKIDAAHFLAQVGHESGSFAFLKEIWGNTPAQQRYDVRVDLGNTPERDGDGKFFLGRGLIQITGAANYKEISLHLFGDDRLIKSPQLLEEPENAVRSACYYWRKRKISAIANRGKTPDIVRQVTRRVNGGVNGLADRQMRFDRAIAVLAV